MRKNAITLVFTLFSIYIPRYKKDSSPSDQDVMDPQFNEASIPATKKPNGGICPSLNTRMTDVQLNRFLSEFKTKWLFMKG